MTNISPAPLDPSDTSHSPTAHFRHQQRTARFLKAEAASLFDVIVIGDGINGLRIALELSLRGLSVLVLGKSDPNRPSYKNSRLMHRGLRYIETFDWQLVQQSMRAVTELLEEARHLVHPIGMLLPVYKQDSLKWKCLMELGLILSEQVKRLAGGSRHLPNYQSMKAETARKRWVPGLALETSSDGLLQHVFLYYDGQISYPERLCTELRQDILAQHSEANPALIFQHVRVTALEETKEAARVQVHFQDDLNPLETGNRQTFTVRAKFVINATGPDLDHVQTQAKEPSKPIMGPTKGTHILLPNKLGLTTAVYSQAKPSGYVQNKRLFFIIPFPGQTTEHPPEYLLIGTTDDKLPYPDGEQATINNSYPLRREVDYLLEATNNRFPTAQFSEDDVITAYAGWRPLPKSNQSAGKITRDHQILASPNSRIWRIVGGKLTTHKELAQETAEKLAQHLPMNPTSHCHVLPGARGYDDFSSFKTQALQENIGHFAAEDFDILNQLIHRYGAAYKQVLEKTNNNPTLKKRITPELPYIKAQVIYAIEDEYAETLSDILIDSLQVDLTPACGKNWQNNPALQALQEYCLNSLQIYLSLRNEDRTKDIEDFQNYIAGNHAWRAEAIKQLPFQKSYEL